MTAAELVAIVRQDYLRDITDADFGNDARAEWSHETLLRYVGEAQRQACYRQDLRHLYDDPADDAGSICSISLDVGNQTYILSDLILRIIEVSYGTTVLYQTTKERIDARGIDWRQARPGPPSAFFIQGHRLTLDHPPGAADVATPLSLYVWRAPLIAPEEMSDRDDLEWVNDPEKLVHWVMHRALLRRDLEIGEQQASAAHLSMFNAAFGQEVPVRARIELLESPDIYFSPGARNMSVLLDFRDRDW